MKPRLHTKQRRTGLAKGRCSGGSKRRGGRCAKATKGGRAGGGAKGRRAGGAKAAKGGCCRRRGVRGGSEEMSRGQQGTVEQRRPRAFKQATATKRGPPHSNPIPGCSPDAAPNAGMLAPKAGLLAAPNAGLLLGAPNGELAAAPKVEPPKAPPAGEAAPVLPLQPSCRDGAHEKRRGGQRPTDVDTGGAAVQRRGMQHAPCGAGAPQHTAPHGSITASPSPPAQPRAPA